MARNIDRISDLPDIIRLQILCLLPRKFAARTSALSWRWRDLWRYRWPYGTSLIFDEECSRGLTPEEFTHTVDQVLKQRGKKKVEIFHIFFNPGTQYQSNTVSWIEYAISNEVEELYLDFSQGFKQEETFQIPNGLLQGDSLTVFNLKYCKFNLPLDFRRLKFLETVSLKYVDVTDNMVLDVISCCPFLERLDLRQCFELRSIKVSGSNLRLKSLVVVNCWKLNEIEIFAPNLRSFHFNGVFLKSYVFGEISSLSDAMMSSWGRKPGICQANWVQIIEDLAHIKVLTLCSRALQQVTISKQSTPILLENLQELQLLMDIMTETSLSDIISFFKKCHCPKLEKVFIELSTGAKDPALKIFLRVPSDETPLLCDFRSLKIVKMNNFNGYKNEMELVRFFLEKASVLESLILVTPQEMHTSVWWLDYRSTMQMNFMKEILANAKVSIHSTSQDLNGLFPTHYDAYCKV